VGFVGDSWMGIEAGQQEVAVGGAGGEFDAAVFAGEHQGFSGHRLGVLVGEGVGDHFEREIGGHFLEHVGATDAIGVDHAVVALTGDHEGRVDLGRAGRVDAIHIEAEDVRLIGGAPIDLNPFGCE